MTYRVIVSLLAVWGITGCSPTLEDPDSIRPDDMIFITTGKNTLKADGKDTTYVTARIPIDAGNIDISFSTSAGSFPVTGGQTISEYASRKDDNYRYAVVVLQSGTTPTDPFWITVEASTARNRHSLSIK